MDTHIPAYPIDATMPPTRSAAAPLAGAGRDGWGDGGGRDGIMIYW